MATVGSPNTTKGCSTISCPLCWVPIRVPLVSSSHCCYDPCPIVVCSIVLSSVSLVIHKRGYISSNRSSLHNYIQVSIALVAVCSTLVGSNTTKVILTEINATYWNPPVSLLFAAEQYFPSSAEQYFSFSLNSISPCRWRVFLLVAEQYFTLSLNSISPRPPRRRSPPIGYSAHWSAWGPLLGNLLSHCCLFKYIALCMCFVLCGCLVHIVFCCCCLFSSIWLMHGVRNIHFSLNFVHSLWYSITILLKGLLSHCCLLNHGLATIVVHFFAETSTVLLIVSLVNVVPLLLFFHCCCFSIVLDSLVRLEENSSSCWCKNQSSVLNIESVAGSYAEKSGCYAGEASCKVHAWNWNMCWNYSCCKDEARCG